MTSVEFYEITKSTLDDLAKSRNITDLNRYYQLTDCKAISLLGRLSGKARILGQMAFHAQNAALISNIVKFERNSLFLEKTLCGFDPKAFLEKYNAVERNQNVQRIVEDLRYNESTKEGLIWKSNKSKPENKDTIIKRYANTLLDCATFVNEYEDEEHFLHALLNHYEYKDFKKLIRFFRSKVKHGYSVALTCDFLKEYNIAFCDLPKPDVHIKDTLCTLYGLDENYYSGEKKERECIAMMQKLVKEINECLSGDEKITVYKLDRMIWLI